MSAGPVTVTTPLEPGSRHLSDEPGLFLPSTDRVRAVLADPDADEKVVTVAAPSLAAAVRARLGVEDASVPVHVIETYTDTTRDSTLEGYSLVELVVGEHRVGFDPDDGNALVALLAFVDGRRADPRSYLGPGDPVRS